MKAKSKPLETIAFADLGVEESQGLKTSSYAAPPKRSKGVMVKDAAELVAALKAATSLPVFIHSHDTAGLAAMCQLKAIECGADNIDTAIGYMAWGTSNPVSYTHLRAHEPKAKIVCRLQLEKK